MSRKSTLAINLLCGVSILALANSGWPSSETAEAGPANRKAVSTLSSKARGIRATRLKGRLSSRRGLRLSAPRRALQPKSLSRTRKLTGKPSARRVKIVAPAVGNARLSIRGADSRLQKLGNGNRVRGFAPVGKVRTTVAKKRTSIAKTRSTVATSKLVKSRKNSKNAPTDTLTLNFAKIETDDRERNRLSSQFQAGSRAGGVKFEGKNAIRHLDATKTSAAFSADGLTGKGTFGPIRSDSRSSRTVLPDGMKVLPATGNALFPALELGRAGSELRRGSSPYASVAQRRDVFTPIGQDGGQGRGGPTGWKPVGESETEFLACLIGNPILCGLSVGFAVGLTINLYPEPEGGGCSCSDGPDGSCC